MMASTTRRNRLQPISTALLLLLAWAGAARLYPPVILPGPVETLQALAALIAEGQLWEPLKRTIARFATGFALAFLLGAGIGAAAGWRESVHAFIRPAISLLQAVPPVSWMLLAIMWFGTNGGAQVLIVMIALMPVFFFNTVEGVRQAPHELLEMAAVYQVSTGKRITGIYMPALKPFWSAAIMVNLGMGWKTVVMAELISGHTGIGASMNTARIYLEMPDVMAWTLVIALLGLSMEQLARKLLHRKGPAGAE
ncbi:ABC transporter permease subunit [Paenibacillus sp. FSL H8-0537]|uniref:ABC transporter permease n=1 Tax=Paenibacillus sp. FSL H8-0537 TaxID=2921399 RepID=UPI003101AAA2